MPKSTRSQFADRLKKFGVTPDDLHADTLRVGRNNRVLLGSTKDRGSFHSPRHLRPSSIDDVKSWLGTPDPLAQTHPKVAARREVRRFPPLELAREADSANLGRGRAISARNGDAIKKELLKKIEPFSTELATLGRSYIYGDSTRLSQWKGLLETLAVKTLFPFWLYNTVIVEAGGVLEFDTGTNILAADRLVIEEGGTIRTFGTLTIDVNTITKQL